jgi:hypothetical protein
VQLILAIFIKNASLYQPLTRFFFGHGANARKFLFG